MQLITSQANSNILKVCESHLDRKTTSSNFRKHTLPATSIQCAAAAELRGDFLVHLQRRLPSSYLEKHNPKGVYIVQFGELGSWRALTIRMTIVKLRDKRWKST